MCPAYQWHWAYFHESRSSWLHAWHEFLYWAPCCPMKTLINSMPHVVGVGVFVCFWGENSHISSAPHRVTVERMKPGCTDTASLPACSPMPGHTLVPMPRFKQLRLHTALRSPCQPGSHKHLLWNIPQAIFVLALITYWLPGLLESRIL